MVVAGTLVVLLAVAALDVVTGAAVKRGLSGADDHLPTNLKRMRPDLVDLPVVNETGLPDDAGGLDEIPMTEDDLEEWEIRQEVAVKCAVARRTGESSWITPDDRFTLTARQSQALLRYFNKDLFDIPDWAMESLEATLDDQDVHWHRAFAALDVSVNDASRPGTLINALDVDPSTQPIRLVIQLFYEHGHDVLTGNTSLPIAVARLSDRHRAKRAIHVLVRLQASCKASREHGSMLYEAIRCRNYHLVPLLLDQPLSLNPWNERGPDGEHPIELLERTSDFDVDREAEFVQDLLVCFKMPDGADGTDDDEDEQDGATSVNSDGDDVEGPLTPSHRLRIAADRITFTPSISSGSSAECAICQERLFGTEQCLTILQLCRHVFHWGCLRPWFKRQGRLAQPFSCPLCRADPAKA
ncbi:RING-type domain-containing protein [Plasmodiophora brassicae]